MSWKVIWQSLKDSDMRRRIVAVLAMLLVFRILAHIPIPLSDPKTMEDILKGALDNSNSQLLDFINVLSGGALQNLAIMLVGLGPYINASIIMQLLTKVLPKLEVMNKEGEYGRKKINQYTRMLTFPLSIIQSIGAIYLVRQSAARISGIGDITANASIGQWILMVAALSGGAMLLMWLGELITEKGIGNGISLLITVGIVSQLPSTIGQIGSSIFDGSSKLNLWGRQIPVNKSGLISGSIIAVAAVAVTVFIVKLNEASRKITINYAKRVQGNRSYGGVTTVLPVKLITAGVIPIIFAVAFLSVPSFAGQIMSSSASLRLQTIGANLSNWFQPPSSTTFSATGFTPYIYPLTYFALVFIFTFFYTSITFNAKEIAESLQKQGGFVEGVRSGLQTEKYLGKIVNRLTLFGALSLGLLALLPIIGQIFLKTNIAIGGTSILILVSVALETMRSLESRALMVTYDQYSNSDYFYDTDDENSSNIKRKDRIKAKLKSLRPKITNFKTKKS